jgi:glucokinase
MILRRGITMNFCIGIDIGGTSIKSALVDSNAQISCTCETPTNTESSDALIASIVQNIQEIIAESKVTPSAVGIGIPGLVSPEGTVTVFANLRILKDIKLADIIRSKISLPVYADNDANCAAAGEFLFGAAKGHQNSITVTLGTGIGAGIIINGSVYKGTRGAAGEAGHMIIVPEGRKCGCGNSGCWETYGSAGALVKSAQNSIEAHRESSLSKYSNDKLNAKIIEDEAKAGDALALKLFEECAYYNGIGTANLMNIFDPGIIVFGGGLSHAGDYLLDRIRATASKLTNATSGKTIITRAQLGNRAGTVGAASLAFMNSGGK